MTDLSFSDGLKFGLGFFVAGLIFWFVVLFLTSVFFGSIFRGLGMLGLTFFI